MAGEPMRVGSAGSDPAPQLDDHEVVRRVRAAGAVVVGLTAVPSCASSAPPTPTFGITRNPWDLSRSRGGSSGGSAAAVASGTVPIALGNDGMGSIRIPAACCGLVGLKPGAGVVPSGLGDGSWFGMAENGPLATTVDDAALLLSVLAGQPGLAARTVARRAAHRGLHPRPRVVRRAGQALAGCRGRVRGPAACGRARRRGRRPAVRPDPAAARGGAVDGGDGVGRPATGRPQSAHRAGRPARRRRTCRPARRSPA